MIKADKRITLIGHRYQLTCETKGVYDAFERTFDLQTVFVDDGWPRSIDDIPDADEMDACIWFVRFRELVEQPAFDWKGYAGHRVMYDHDVHANYHTMLGPKWLGKWPDEFRRHGFHLLVTTSKSCSERLNADGIPALWLAKGFEHGFFYDQERERQDICFFGNPYRSRRAMLRYVAASDIPIKRFVCKHEDLNKHLNQYIGCVICNMGGVVQGNVNRLVHKLFPTRGIVLEPGIEAMLKNFEVAASGCAPIADWIDELGDLGFTDGENIVAYRTFDELVEKLHHYQNAPDELRQIGKNAAALAAANHTWDNRAQQLNEYLTTLSGPSSGPSSGPELSSQGAI